MSEHKLVPFEPTPEMVSAAEDAYMPFGDMELALRMAILAAPAVQGEPGVKWAPEEVANGNKGIRWVSDEGVHGRPTDHDCRVYLESNPNARGCHCPECTKLYTAPQPAEQQPAPDVAGLVQQHHRDSAELRRLCQARDEQRDGRLAALERAAKAEADVTQMVEALDLALEYWRDRQQRYKNRRPRWVIAAESALAAHRKGGEA